MKPEGLHLAVGDDDEAAVFEAVAGMGGAYNLDAAHRYVGWERLYLLDHHRTDLVLGIGRFGVDSLYHLAVVRADEEDVVGLAAGRLHLRVHRDLREPVAVTMAIERLVICWFVGEMVFWDRRRILMKGFDAVFLRSDCIEIDVKMRFL